MDKSSIFTKHPLAAAIALATSALVFNTNAIAAEEAPASAEDRAAKAKQQEELEVIQVYGIRSSLENALNKKRTANQIMDSISSEDIGQLPDNNLADALQRITGIQSDRGPEGEGASISVRGSQIGSITINGIDLPNASDSRSVNFEDFNAEMFSALEILKTPTAKQIEGTSLGGTVNLKLARPLDKKKDHSVTINAQTEYTELVEEHAPRASIFGHKNFDLGDMGRLGFLANLSYREAINRGDTVQVRWRSREWNRGEGKGQFSGPEELGDSPNLLTVREFRSRSRLRESDRIGGQFTAQWEPQEDWRITAETSLFKRKEDQFYNQVRIVDTLGLKKKVFNEATSSGLTIADMDAIDPQPFTVVTLNEDFSQATSADYHIVRAATLDTATLDSVGNPSVGREDADTKNFVLESDYRGEDWRLVASYSHGVAEEVEDKFNTTLKLGEGKDFSYRYNLNNGQDVPDLIMLDGEGERVDFTDPTNPWALTKVQFQRKANKQTKREFKLDYSQFLDTEIITSFDVGIRWSETEVDRRNTIALNAHDKNGFAPGSTQFDTCVNPVAPNNFNAGISGDYATSWLTFDCGINQGIDQFTQGLIADIVERRLADRYEAKDKEVKSGDVAEGDKTGTALEAEEDFATLANLSSEYLEQINVELTEEDQAQISNLLASNLAPYLKGDVSNIPRQDVAVETIKSIYGMLNLDTELFGDMYLTGNFGLRYSELEVKTNGADIVDQDGNPIENQGGYKKLLPSLNLNLELMEDMFVRLGVAKTVKKPKLSDMRGGVTFLTPEEDAEVPVELKIGNPGIEPIEAKTYDLSWEWYFSKGSLLSAAAFHRDIKNRRLNIVGPYEFAGDVFLARFPTTVDTDYGDTTGFEFGYQQSFEEVFDGWLKNTGMTFNYTNLNRDQDPRKVNVLGQTRLEVDTSESSYNFAVYYDDGKLSSRIAYVWRDQYIQGRSAGESITGLPKTTLLGDLDVGNKANADFLYSDIAYVDLSVNYKFTKQFKVNFSMNNATSTLRKNYKTEDERLDRAWTKAGWRATLGVKYSFF